METKTLNINASFEVTLKGKGTAGYEWQYNITPTDIVSVERIKQPANESRPPIPGSSSDEIFTITALKKGSCTLHFYLVRTWEPPSVGPKDEKKIKITVE